MAEKKRDILVPGYDGGLMDARYLKGSSFVVTTRAQRNALKALYRTLDALYTTICYVSSEQTWYELINNPLTDVTADTDWRIITVGGGSAGATNIDGGRPSSVYTVVQNIDGGQPDEIEIVSGID